MTQLQILAVPGSLRAGSWNAALLRLAQERAPEGVHVEIWDGLRHVPPFSEDHEDPGTASVEDLRAAIAAADALLVSAPRRPSERPVSSRTRSTGPAAPTASPPSWASPRP